MRPNRFIVWIFFSAFFCATLPARADSCYLFLSCAPDKNFHPVQCNNTGCTDASGADAVPLVTMYIENHGWAVFANLEGVRQPQIMLPINFYRAWLEFSDAGHAWQEQQKTAILHKIEELGKSKRPLLIVVYIHGWHNNADNNNPETDRSRNAVKFDYFLARHADQARRLFEQRGHATPPAVLGIYVGWRGDSLTTPGLKMTTIGDRAEAANRLAENHLYSTDLGPSLRDIASALHRADPNGRMMVVGHSLGGRIVTRLFMGDIAQGKEQPLGKNSLLVALEPAIGADCYDQTLGPTHKGKGGPPTFASVTSQSDSAVGWIYRIGSVIIPDCDSSSPAHGVSIGDYDAYLTHQVLYNYDEKKLIAPDPSVTFPPDNSPDNWFEVAGRKSVIYRKRNAQCDENNVVACYDSGDAQTYTMDFLARANVAHAGPVWNVLTDTTVIDLENDPGTINGEHNGYVSTNLTRALIEILYAKTP